MRSGRDWLKWLCAGMTLIAIATISSAQTGTLSGRVIDASTLEPLPFANVFLNNTTIGTAADDAGNFTLEHVPAGSQEVVFSFIGYNSFQARYQISDGEVTRVNIRLTTTQQVLGEVAITAARDKAWEKQLRKFEKIFLGEDDFGRKCRINNPWVMEFKNEGSRFSATASAPVDIVNEALGYRLTFHLKEFITDASTYSIVGNTRYEEIPATTADEALHWTRNRQTAYMRSPRHFFKSLVEQRLSEDGFRLYRDAGPGTPARSNSFNTEIVKNIRQYEPGAVVQPGATIYELKVPLDQRTEVHYLNEATRTFFYKDVGHSVSWLEAKGGVVRVTREGVVLNPRELVVSGDMSLARIADMLPLDYKPGVVARIKPKMQFLAQRYEERAYVQINKAYFYPGETLWFKAYVACRDMTKKDSLSNVLYVDFLDPHQEVVQTRSLRLDSIRHGEFRLPADITPGLYSIRAYTNWMMNYGTRSTYSSPVPVLDPYDRIKGDEQKISPADGLIDFALSKAEYGTREKVEFTISARDDDGVPLAGDFSVSVVDVKQVRTVGWSNSITEALRFGELQLPSSTFSHRVEKGLTLRGRIGAGKGKGEVKDVTLILGNFDGVFTTSTDANGVFAIHDLPFYDSATVAIQARSKKGKAHVRVTPLPRPLPISAFRASEYTYEVEHQSTVQNVVPSYERNPEVIMLKEVSVTATRVETEKPASNTYGQADKVFQNETLVKRGSTLGTVLQGMMPGYTLAFLTDHWYFIRDRNLASSGRQFREQDPQKISRTAPVQAAPAEPVLVINNALFMAGAAETVGDRLQSINTANVDRVEVNSPMGSLTGSLGAAGVINVYIKDGTTADASKPTQFIHKVKGFDMPAAFLSPDHSNMTTGELDLRSAIYWNPSLTPDDTGNCRISFYTADLATTYLITLEGLLINGTPVRAQATIEVK